MSHVEISKRYAKAFFLTVKEDKQDESAYADLMLISDVVKKTTDVQAFFSNPLISSELKKKALQDAISADLKSKDTLKIIDLLAANDRLEILPEVAIAFRNLMDTEMGVTRGEAVSAEEMSSEDKASLESRLAKALGKKIQLNYKTDRTIMGGVVVTVGGMKFDDSLKTHLKNMNDELHRRAH